MLKLLIILLGLAGAGFSQTANIVKIDVKVSEGLKAKYEALKKAEEAFNKAKAVVEKQLGISNCGLEFDKTFSMATPRLCRIAPTTYWEGENRTLLQKTQ
jgi:hypothetical protein